MKNIKHSISHINPAHILAAAGLIVIFAATSFYYTNGYIDIGNDKYQIFMKTAPVAVIAWVLLRVGLYLTDKGSQSISKIIGGFGAADWFMIMMIGVSVISTLTSEFKHTAVWGQDGWNLGLIVWLLMTGMYLMARDTARSASSKFIRGVFHVFLVISAIVFILGTINRYSIYPIHMMGEAEDFISTIGNINWFCGYWCVWFGLGLGAFLTAEKPLQKVMYGLYLWICAMAGVSCGSSSCYLAFLAVSFAGLMWALEDTDRLASLCLAQIIMFSALPGIRLIGWARPYRMWYDSELLRQLTYGDAWLAPWVGSIVVFGVLYDICLKYSSKTLAKTPEGRDKNNRIKKALNRIRDILIGVSCGGAFALILVIFLNSVVEGGIWPVRGMGIFTWGIRWGNGRGGIWIATMKIIGTMLPLKIFFGVGPDCFCAYAYSMTDMAILLNRYIGNQYLTCAHNELLTVLVNTGIFGAIAFAGTVISHIRCGIRGKVNIGLLLGMSAYIAVGMVGFAQILSTPWFFVVMGVAAGLYRKGH